MIQINSGFLDFNRTLVIRNTYEAALKVLRKHLSNSELKAERDALKELRQSRELGTQARRSAQVLGRKVRSYLNRRAGAKRVRDCQKKARQQDEWAVSCRLGVF